MNRDLLNRYKQNKRELELIDAALAGLEAQLDGVAIIPGKVTKSSDDYPYIEEHVSVEMPEPREASRIREKMATKEQGGARSRGRCARWRNISRGCRRG